MKNIKIKDKKESFFYKINSKLKVSLDKKLLLLAILPALIIGLLTTVLISSMLIKNTEEQTESNLYSAAITLMSAIEQNSGDYFYANNGDLWKGGYNISKSESLLKNIRENTDLCISILSKDSIVISTETQKENPEIEIEEEIFDLVFKEQNEVFSDSMYQEGARQYMYAIPMIQPHNTDETSGMLVVSVDKDKQLSSTRSLVALVAVIIVIVVVVIIIFVSIFSRRIMKSLKRGFEALVLVAKGDLRVDKSSLDLKRKDEIGDMNNSILELVTGLKTIISDNIDITNQLDDTFNSLDETVRSTKDSVGIIDSAMDTMKTSAKKQSDIVGKVSEDMQVLGEMIENTYSDIQVIAGKNTGMQQSCRTANNIVDELNYIKMTLNDVIEVINNQTTDTYTLSKEIKKYAEMIASFADETNLLALNATIEAARVGEQGKGFAIVANQIQNLADQSNTVSSDITQSVKLLVDDSKQSIQTMEKVNIIVEKLNQNIDNTKSIFDVVNDGIDNSLVSLNKIESQASVMDKARVSITEVINELESVVEQNKKMAADTEEVTEHIVALFSEANNLKTVTNKLVQSMDVFEL